LKGLLLMRAPTLDGLGGTAISVMRHGEVEDQVTAPIGVLQVLVEDLNVTAAGPLGWRSDRRSLFPPLFACQTGRVFS